MSRFATALCSVAAAALLSSKPALAHGDFCVGDCDLQGSVAINELILGVNILLGSAEPSQCPAYSDEVELDISQLVTAVNNLLNGCPAPPGTLGVRHFSFDPSASHILTQIAAGFPPFPAFGFEGSLDLSAGVPDPQTGIASLDVTDTSEYLSLNIPAVSLAFCIKVPRDQLPVRQAGLVSCNGGVPLGFQVTIDHNIGVVDRCTGGERSGELCDPGDPVACPGGGECLSRDLCTSRGGIVDLDGVCNGPLEPSLLPGDSGPGAVLISPDPENGLIQGLPAEFITERATPCGDEPEAVGFSTVLAFTTGHSRCEIRDFNNNDGATLTTEADGEAFSCDQWSTENGPGILQFCVPVLNQPGISSQPIDVITTFIFSDRPAQ